LYFRAKVERATSPSISSGLRMSIRLAGARSRVWASGVGVPFSLRAVTSASPMPSAVISSSTS